MIVRHFDIETPEVKPKVNDGWEQLPSGYYRMTKCISADRKIRDDERIRNMREAGIMSAGEFQQDCLLSILADIKRDEVNIFELGAGWGRICLNIAGLIDFNIIQCTPKRYRCLAVEAEPTHYLWLSEHFRAQNINGTAVFGAVSNKNGSCHFTVHDRPDYHYGQSMNPATIKGVIPCVKNLSRIMTGKTVKVPTYTIDHLVEEYGFDHIDIVQMDVQGAEYAAIQGSSGCIKKGMIDYFLINVHLEKYSKMLPILLADNYELVIDLKRLNSGVVLGFPPIQCHDGFQLFKRKAI